MSSPTHFQCVFDAYLIDLRGKQFLAPIADPNFLQVKLELRCALDKHAFSKFENSEGSILVFLFI